MHLIDQACANAGSFMDKKAVGLIKQRARIAKRFVFDDSAISLLKALTDDTGGMLTRNVEFALPPFPDTYVEVPTEAVGIGYGLLFDANGMIFTAMVQEGREAILMPFGLLMRQVSGRHLPPDVRPLEAPPDGDWTFSSGLAEALSEWFSVMPFVSDVTRAKDFPQHGSLIASIATAVLLILDRQAEITFTHRPPARRWYGNKLRPYAAHSIVSIRSGRTKSLHRSFLRTDRATARRHEVRGHYVHYGLIGPCEHSWDRLEGEEKKRWRCSKCGARRTWREGHHRGDASIGFKTKDYSVQA